MKSAAIVSLMIGGTYRAMWEKYCAANWQAYANKYGLDLVVIDQALDCSPRAMSRSPAWQKCLVWSQEFARQYRQIILLDSDIAINARIAPLILDQVPVDRVGGTIAGGHIHEDLRIVLLNRLSGKHHEYQPGPALWRFNQDGYYRMYGLTPFAEGIVNTGMLVASPHEHAELFAAVYQRDYAETRCYEQIPLSHALLSGGVYQGIDTRFNSLFYESLVVHYPYLISPQTPHFEELAAHAVRVQYETNFFLHFAYDPSFMRFLDI
jgi:hypothetical protein